MTSKHYLLIFFSFLSLTALAQNGSIKGKIFDGKSHEPLPGAYLHLDGTNKGTSTDAFGNFEFDNLAPNEYKVKIKYVGFEKYEKEVTLKPGQILILNVELKEVS